MVLWVITCRGVASAWRMRHHVRMKNKIQRSKGALDPYSTGHCGYSYKRIPVPGVLCHRLIEHKEFRIWVLTELPEAPWTGTDVLQSIQKFQVLWHRRRELTKVSTGYIKGVLPYPGYCGHGCTELTDVPGKGSKVVPNIQKFWVRV